MDVSGKNALIVGLGISGVAVANFLLQKGALVTVTDRAPEHTLGDHVSRMRDMGVNMELGQHRTKTFQNADFIVVSPGVPHDIPPIKQAVDNGVLLIGEMELAFRFIQEPIVAVTGTNGKTTTTELLGMMLDQSGIRVFVGGNIGTPLIRYAAQEDKADMVVVEVSSFQLDTIEMFRPKVSVLLNITQDHLDRYQDFTAYAHAKARIFENQRPDDTAVLNGGDATVLTFCKDISAKKLIYCHGDDVSNEIKADAIIADAHIEIGLGGNCQGTLSLTNTRLVGRHNHENIAAAALAALSSGGTFEGIQSAIDSFKEISHRLQYIGTINEVQYFDDSKATNIDAVVKALDAFNQPVILILGGRNKGSDFRMLQKPVQDHVKCMVVIGEATDDIRISLEGVAPMAIAATMEDAVVQAHNQASPGDVVLLSPGCASFDMFSNYAERGEVFCGAVNQLGPSKETGSPP